MGPIITVDVSDDQEADTSTPSHDDIARLAYALWERRGGACGSAEEDWFRAEHSLRPGTFA